MRQLKKRDQQSVLPGIYKAVRGAEVVVGSPREIEKSTGIYYDYVRRLANSGSKTKTGWRVKRVRPAIYITREFLAECPGEDPIIGPADEISALTGVELWKVREAIRTGKSVCGWTIRTYRRGE